MMFRHRFFRLIAFRAESSLSYADNVNAYSSLSWVEIIFRTIATIVISKYNAFCYVIHTPYLVQVRISNVIEATQKAGADRVAVSSLAQLIAFQARHGWRFILATVGLVTALGPANECHLSEQFARKRIVRW